jgi:Flp pilus assembly protein TadD
VALKNNPANAEARINRAKVLKQIGRLDEALAECGQLVALGGAAPDRLDEAGEILFQAGRFAEALDAFDQALSADPGHVSAAANRAAALRGLGRTQEALAAVDVALALDPGLTRAWANRGCFLIELDRDAEGVDSLRRALAVGPEDADAWYNLAGGLAKLGQVDEALAAYDRAIALRPDHAGAHWNKCLLLLRSGRPEGWRLFEWRWRSEALSERPTISDRPAWDGRQPVAGKTIVLHYEQGFGDSIQMLRYIPLLADKGARILLAVQPELAPLCQALPCEVIPPGGPSFPDHDVQAFLMSLPAAFGAAEGQIPNAVPYLQAPEAARRRWAQCLGPRVRPRVGLVWSGSRGHRNDANRSLPLEALEPWLGREVDLISLQKDVRPADRAAFDRLGLDDVSGDLTDFGETAGLIQALDLVVSVDTAVAHLAGALGKPLILLLPRHGDYRWGDEGEATPWYPTATLLRQTADGDWRPALERMGEMLAALPTPPPSSAPPRRPSSTGPRPAT